ncbi:hypothetical protein CAPTEDRAFT_226537 [Capitella teleta]|uniref:acid phosphatase n=1 Tax=Capitella teleta TaxID=283909 RepID=R7TRK3_CAPTE|nr:hypothetical protein CAPTEDRAFT_226537 [Capitella teleta]|eukprot:ELT96207.1 hypothetical protein CAPTEDRAFT_226537 [Capitella teleta]
MGVAFQRSFLIFLVLSVLLQSWSVYADDTNHLLLVQALYRHGDRSPVSTFPNDPVSESVWPQGLGQLTQKGMQQHYKLGQYLRQRYIEGQPYKFLSEAYKKNEIMINSTDYDRTLMSAYSNLAGFYPPKGDQIWKTELKWQPIPVHTKPLDMDHVLYMDNYCPTYMKHYAEALNSDVVKKHEAENAEFYSFLEEKSGFPKVSIENTWMIYDTLFCESQHNHALPDWAAQQWKNSSLTVMQKMAANDGLQFDIKYDHPVQRRLKGGSLLKAVIDNMQMKVTSTLTPATMKAFIYSAHDSTVSAFLSAMQVFNKRLPPYTACVLVELHAVNDIPHVKVLYGNSTAGEPYVLSIPGCAELCPLPKFIELTKESIPDDWVEECGLGSGFPKLSKMHIIIIASISAVVLVTIIATIVGVIYRRKLNSNFTPYFGLNTNT